MAKDENHSFIIQNMEKIRNLLWNYPYFIMDFLKHIHRLKNFILIVLFAAILFYSYSVIYSQLEQGSYTSHSLILGIVATDSTYNPLSDSMLTHILNKLIFNQIFSLTNQGVLNADLAGSWTINNSNTIINFHLNPKAKWQDGKNISVDDIIYSFTIQKKLNIDSPLSKMAIKKTGDASFEIDLTPLNTNYLETLLWPIFPKQQSNTSLEVVGSGPYKLIASKKNEYDLEANANYFKGNPHIQSVKLYTFHSEKELKNAYESGNINTIIVSNPNYTMREKIVAMNQDTLYESQILTDYYALFFNLLTYKDINIRKGINYSINKSQIMQALHEYGSILNTPLNPESWASTKDPVIQTYQFNTAKAMQNFGLGGYTLQNNKLVNKQQIPLLVKIAYEQNTTQSDILKIISHNLESMGISVELQEFSSAEWSQKIFNVKNFDIAFVPIQGSIDPNPISLWDSVGVNNISSYTNASVDRYLDLAKNTTDRLQRQRAYDLFQRAVMDDDPAIFLYSQSMILETKKEIKGIHFRKNITSEGDLLDKINEWYF